MAKVHRVGMNISTIFKAKTFHPKDPSWQPVTGVGTFMLMGRRTVKLMIARFTHSCLSQRVGFG